MKKKLTLAAVLLVSMVVSFAGSGKKTMPQSSRVISIESSYVKVLVGENLKVVFTTDSESELTVSGDTKFVDGVEAKVIDGVLRISVKGSTKYSGTIYVPVKNNLAEIVVKPASRVYSNGFLNCNHLNVLISDGGYAHLKNKGNMEIKAVDSELQFEKYECISER